MRGQLFVGLCLLAVAYAQPSNQYEAEGKVEPLKQPVIFTVTDLEKSKINSLPSANLVIAVVSSPDHFDQREAVRSSWAQLVSLNDPKLNSLTLEEKQSMVIRFIIGHTKDASLDKALAKENLKYRDIVRVDVEESYFHLTQKTAELMKWAYSTYNFKWLMKCDDDSFVRIDQLLIALKTAPQERLYMGKIWTGTPADRRVDTYTPFQSYNSFAAGAGYVLTADLVRYLVRNLPNLHMWPMEDVAVGMWLSPLDIHVLDNPHFHSLPEGCDKDMIVQNPAKPDVMREVFFNSVKGVPCHSKPDPFDPSTKNVPDHVLLELGIPKPGAGNSKHHDGDQMLLEMPMEAEEANLDEEADVEGMNEATMNGNLASGTAASEMNRSTGVMEVKEHLDTAATAAEMAMNDPSPMNLL